MRGEGYNTAPATELCVLDAYPEMHCRHRLSFRDQWKEGRGSNKIGEKLQYLLHMVSDLPKCSSVCPKWFFLVLYLTQLLESGNKEPGS